VNPLLTKQFVPLDPAKVKELIAQYIGGDSEAALPILQSVGPWIMNIVNAHYIPPSVERDDIYSEITAAILSSLKNYDASLSSLTNFIHLICRKRLPRIISTLAGCDQYLTLGEGDFSDRVKPLMIRDEHLAPSQQRVVIQQMNGDYDTIDRHQEPTGMPSDDKEVLRLAIDIMHTHFDEFERQVFIDYLNDLSYETIAKRANALLSETQDSIAAMTLEAVNATGLDGPPFDDRVLKAARILCVMHGDGTQRRHAQTSIRQAIADVTAKLRAEMQQRGVLDSGGELQRLMYS